MATFVLGPQIGVLGQFSKTAVRLLRFSGYGIGELSNAVNEGDGGRHAAVMMGSERAIAGTLDAEGAAAEDVV